MSNVFSFFKKADEDEESDEEVQQNDEVDEGAQEQSKTKSSFNFGKWGLDEEEEDDKIRRVVKSHKDKRFEELQGCADKIHQKITINDWNSISDEFDKLLKTYAKLAPIVQKEGVPRPYLRCLVNLDDALKKTSEDNEAKKKMNKTNSKCFNKMRQTVKRITADLASELENYRKNPDQEEFPTPSSSPVPPTEPTTTTTAPPPKTKPAPKPPKDEDEEGDIDWSEDEDEPRKPAPAEEDEEEEEETAGFFRQKAGPSAARDEEESDEDWIESTEEAPKQRHKEATGAAPAGPSRWFKEEKEDEDEEGFTAVRRRPHKPKQLQAAHVPAPAVPEPTQKPISALNDEEVEKRLKDIVAQRGRKSAGPLVVIEELDELIPHVRNVPLLIEALGHLITSQLDTDTLNQAMPIPIWKSCQANLVRIIELFDQHRAQIVLNEPDVADQPDEQQPQGASPMKLSLGLYPFLVKLANSLTHSLQGIDPHLKDYITRLQDEQPLLELCERGQAYYASIGAHRLVARVASLRIEHTYYKRTPTDVALLPALAALVYRWGDERSKTRATLCQVYQLALVDRYYEARDMFLMSHAHESIPQQASQMAQGYAHQAALGTSTPNTEADIALNILYNRTLVQLGLSAFRLGLTQESFNALSEICSTTRLRELLAQGIAGGRYPQDRPTPEQEKLEKRRLLPFHLHINLELLEAVHLVCALLIEVPSMAASAQEARKKVVSKYFRKMLDFYDRQIFTGPPENARDFVGAAARAMMDADWRQATQHALAIPAWALLPKADEIKAMIARRIQEETLRTHLFNASAYYESVGLEELQEMFEMPAPRVHALVSKMMITEEIRASWDTTSSNVVFHRQEPSRLQLLCLQLSEKATQLVENNERILDIKTGGWGKERGERGEREHKEAWVPSWHKPPQQLQQRGFFQRRPGQVTRYDTHSARRPTFTRF